MPRSTVIELESRSDGKTRFEWLDVLRVLCAFQIVGFHWLRAAVKTGQLAQNHADNLIVSYRQLDVGIIGGLRLLDVFNDSRSPPHRWLVNTVAALFTFGWEAVFVFVLLSGVALGLSLNGRWSPASWLFWMKSRLTRILIPYYLIATVISVLMYAGLALTASRKSGTLEQIHEKLAGLTGPDVAGVLLSQLLLLNPHQPFWSATFLAAAWWFVPAILLAYACFPLYMILLHRVGWAKFLGVGALVSIVSYELQLIGRVQEFSWWYVVLNECFNFFLGIVLGCALCKPKGRAKIEEALNSPIWLGLAVVGIIAGNVCNLYRATYAISSLLFTGPLAFCGAVAARYVLRWRWSRSLLKIDPYLLYLVHQPFAFPVVLAAPLLLGHNSFMLGMLLYFALAIVTAFSFGRLLVFALAISPSLRATGSGRGKV